MNLFLKRMTQGAKRLNAPSYNKDRFRQFEEELILLYKDAVNGRVYLQGEKDFEANKLNKNKEN